MLRRIFLAVPTLAILLTVTPALFAQSAEASIEQLGDVIKPMLMNAIPANLYSNSDNWGHQANVPVGVKWVRLKAQVQKSPRNHGEWRRTFITAQDLKRTLDLKIYDAKSISAEKQTFKVLLTFQMGVEYEQQNWANGVRLWSGSVRARAQVKLVMDCEDTIRFDTSKNAIIPDVIVRAKATRADLTYDKLVVEHINGVGGDAAKIIGKAVHDVVKKARPSLERDLLAKANESIVRAADTKEIRLSFGNLLKTK